MKNIRDAHRAQGNIATAGFTVADILHENGFGGIYEQDWHSDIPALNPAVLDLGCGSDHTDSTRILQWFPYVPVILGTHGADPSRIVGVDLMSFKYSADIYTHLTEDLVTVVNKGDLEKFLKPHTPEGKFDAIIINNLFDSPEMADTLGYNHVQEREFRGALFSQIPDLLGQKGVIITDGTLLSTSRRQEF